MKTPKSEIDKRYEEKHKDEQGGTRRVGNVYE